MNRTRWLAAINGNVSVAAAILSVGITASTSVENGTLRELLLYLFYHTPILKLIGFTARIFSEIVIPKYHSRDITM
jgi:hypothetical protein